MDDALWLKLLIVAGVLLAVGGRWVVRWWFSVDVVIARLTEIRDALRAQSVASEPARAPGPPIPSRPDPGRVSPPAPPTARPNAARPNAAGLRWQD